MALADMASPGWVTPPDMAQAPDLAQAPDMTLPPTHFDFSPAMLTFPNSIVNRDTQYLSVTISHYDSTQIDSVAITLGTGSDQLAIISDGCAGTTTSSCSVTVRYLPTKPIAVSASLTIKTHTASFTGCAITASADVATPQLSVDPTTLDFGDVHVKTASSSLGVLVRNSGSGDTSNLTASIDPPGGPFTLDSINHSDSCGTILSAGSWCRVYVVFNPQQMSPLTAKLNIADGSISAPVVTLNGRGINPAALQVTASGPFASQWLGSSSADVTFHVTNGGGTASGMLTASVTGDDPTDFNVTSDGCTGQTLDGQASCDIKLHFTPIARGSRDAMLNVSATPGGSVATPLQGVALAPATLTLVDGNGTVSVDKTAIATLGFTLRNDGDGATAPLALNLAGTSSGKFSFAPGGSCANAVLTAGQTCWFSVYFIPTYQGHWTDSVTASAPNTTPAVTPLTIPLDGTFASADKLRALPAALRFGSVNRSGWDYLDIWNTTAQPLGPLALSISGDSNFSILDGTACAGVTLDAGAVCKIKVQYTPTITGTFTGSISVTAPNSSIVVPLSASSRLPALSFNPAKADFGTVAIGVVPPIAITVTNVSNRPAPTSYVVSNSNFWVTSSCPATLQPAPAPNTCTISVGFGPQAAGTYNGTVTFAGATTADASSVLPIVGIAQ
jgi:hypothetical protein